MKINRLELLTYLNIGSAFLAFKDMSPVLKSFCFQEGKIYAYNGTGAIVMDYDIGVDCVVLGIDFINLLNSYYSPEIDIQLDENQDLLIKGDRKKASRFKVEQGVAFKWKADRLCGPELVFTEDHLEALKLCSGTVYKGGDQPALQGPQLTKTEDRTIINSCNVDILTNVDVPDFEELPLGRYFLPMLFCEQIYKAADLLEAPVKVILNDKGASAIIGDDKIIITTLSPDGLNLVNYADTVSMYMDAPFLELNDELFNGMYSLSHLDQKQNAYVIEMRLKHGILYCNARTQLMDINDEFEVDSDEILSFKILPEVLLKSLKSVGTKDSKIAFCNDVLILANSKVVHLVSHYESEVKGKL